MATSTSLLSNDMLKANEYGSTYHELINNRHITTNERRPVHERTDFAYQQDTKFQNISDIPQSASHRGATGSPCHEMNLEVSMTTHHLACASIAENARGGCTISTQTDEFFQERLLPLSQNIDAESTERKTGIISGLSSANPMNNEHKWQILLQESFPTTSFLQLLSHKVTNMRVATCNLLLIITQKKISSPNILFHFQKAIEILTTHLEAPERRKLSLAANILENDSGTVVDPAKYALCVGTLHNLFNRYVDIDGSSLPTVEVWRKADKNKRGLIVRFAIGHEQYLKQQSATPFFPIAGHLLLQKIEKTKKDAFINLARWWHFWKSKEQKLAIGMQRFSQFSPEDQITKCGLIILEAADTVEKRDAFQRRFNRY